jgi:uncharacterized phage protein (TIGR02218 family)
LQLAIDDVAPAWFSYGLIAFTSGLLANLNFLIRDHQQNGQIAELTMWEAMAQLPAIGDQVNVIAGCDKSFQMCRQKFANQSQFRGFPHIPGIDILMSYANQNAVMDGGSLFK